jgi:YD repeat-containing protein
MGWKEERGHSDILLFQTKKTDRLGRVIEYAYNSFDELTTEVWKSGGSTLRTLSYEYDVRGNLIGASDPAAEYSYIVDVFGNTCGSPCRMAAASLLRCSAKQP